MTNKNSTYRRLGDYIREISVRNKDLSVSKLMGINIDKYFMPSVANVIGTDMSNYKVVANGQFACNLMHVGRDEKIPVALNTEDPIIVSPAYFVFEVCDNTLLPEYLELSLRNPEFDRNAWFHTDGDVRGGMDKEGMKDLLIPVPPLEEQRSIVSRYKAIETRIATNKQTIAKLEEAAQALYRKMFVDDVDVENLPEGWRMGKLGEMCDVRDGTHDSPMPCEVGNPLVTSQNLTPWSVDINGAYNISRNDFEKINKRSKVDYKDILLSMIGTIGTVCYVLNKKIDFAVKNVAIFKTSKNQSIGNYLLTHFKSYKMKCWIDSSLAGSTQSYITLSMLRDMPIVVPSDAHLVLFNNQTNYMFDEIDILNRENEILMKMLSLMA